jgi:hypothetical protein
MSKGVTMCSGTENRVVDLRRLTGDKDYVVDYLEKHAKLFDSYAVDINQINSIITFLSKEGLIIPQKEKALRDYLTWHKMCGLYMYVDPISPTVSFDTNNEENNE